MSNEDATMSDAEWIDVGSAEELGQRPLQQVHLGKKPIALSCQGGAFSAISGACNHAGGPLGDGTLDGDYVVCPWHYWKFHRVTGEGEPGYEADRVPRHEVKVVNGRVLVNPAPATTRQKSPHPPHPLARDPVPHDGPPRVLAISTTAMDPGHPRTSTSELLLEATLEHARANGLETRLLKLSALAFRACEGFYSKSSHACTWPCSITQMDPQDQMEQVYEGIVHWADVILVATPIRWGTASSLYHKMVERMNCVQNQITIRDTVLIRDKVAGFVITGGQDNIQAVAGSMLGFFAEIGCVFPPFPYVAHSRGWSAEDMENNVRFVEGSEELREGARALLDRCVELSRRLRERGICAGKVPRGGRKAHRER
jgi:multimeric flavodoxin WrbA/nitrite reductase/ring-hydroxylating ferredoxin subunit